MDSPRMLIFVLDPTPILGTGFVTPPMLRRSLVYSNLDIEQNMVTVKWIGANCSAFFEVQGYTLDHLQHDNYTTPEVVIRRNSDTAEIPSNLLTTSTGDPIYYRLVAVFDNGIICSHDGTKNTFYRFDGNCTNLLSRLIQRLPSQRYFVPFNLAVV